MATLLLPPAIAFNLYHLYPEVTIQAAMLNDGVLHLLTPLLAADILLGLDFASYVWRRAGRYAGFCL